MHTQTYSNRTESVQVIMDGECLGCNRSARTVVRRTTCKRFAIIPTTGTRLIKVLPDENWARNYNSKIQPE